MPSPQDPNQSFLSSILGWMQSPERTQAMQGVGGSVQSSIENLQESDARYQALMNKAFANPKRPTEVTDPEAFAELTDMTMAGPMGFAAGGMLAKHGKSLLGAFDPRFDPRAKEQARLQQMARNIELNPGAVDAPPISLADLEGRPFLTSMSDRTAAGGRLVGIDDVNFNRPVDLVGGQDYMFNNPGQVWASAKGPVNQLMRQANEIKQATGQDPLLMPWRMAPTGGDFAHMTGETMLAYADAAMGKMKKRSMDKEIKKLIPGWSGVSDPVSVEQFRKAPDKVRKEIKNMLDVNFRDEGGLNIGGARLAVTDPAQMRGQDAGLMNVGEIFTNNPIIQQTAHPSYPKGVPGRGIGTLQEDINVFQLLPEFSRARGIPDPTSPRATDIRALQMKPYSGVITGDLLKSLGY